MTIKFNKDGVTGTLEPTFAGYKFYFTGDPKMLLGHIIDTLKKYNYLVENYNINERYLTVFPIH